MEDMIDVKMPPEPEPPQSADEPPLPTTDDPVEMQVEEAPEDEPEPPPREHIPDEDVFKDAPSIKKVKRKCSQKQLDHLAKCREKALAKKREQKEFAERQREKQRRYVEAERRANPPKPKPKPQPRQRQPPPPDPQIYYEEEDFPYEEPPQQNTYQGQEYPEIFHKLTASEIRAIQKDAINDYEIVRKERKHKKRMEAEQQRVEQERRKIMGMMSGRQPKIAHDEDPWSSAFSF